MMGGRDLVLGREDEGIIAFSECRNMVITGSMYKEFSRPRATIATNGKR